MKKNLIALLVVALVTVGLFAATNPDPSSFQVTANVGGINLMKITTAKYTGTSPTGFANNTTTPIYAGPLSVSSYGTQDFTAYISTMSNNRAGYKVTMSATAMKSSITDQADSYINYTVTANSKSIITNGATAASSQDVITVSALSGLAVESHLITLSVDQTTFEAAVEGSYAGTVTFTYIGN